MKAGRLIRENARDEASGVRTVARPRAEVLAEIIEQCGDTPECAPLKAAAEAELKEVS